MGLFGNKNKTAVFKIIDLLNSGGSILSINRQLYDIPEVRTVVNFIAEKVGSVPFYHVRAAPDGSIDMVNDRLQYMLTVRTNPMQSPQVFWTFVATRLLLANNAYILPEWDEDGYPRALYPLPYTTHQMKYQDGKQLIIFNSSGETTFYYDDIIHLQRFPAANGGSRFQATGNYSEMLSAMQNQAVKDSANSQRISALLKNATPLKGEAMKNMLKEFKELFLTSENTTGFGMIPGGMEVVPLTGRNSPLNRELMESIVGYLYNYFGSSKEIITHTASELQNEQFVDNTIKPIIYQIEEEMTYKLFSRGEINHNNKIQAELIDLEISTLSAKTAFYKEMIFGGVMNRNEVRQRLSLTKGPANLDEYMTSKNFEQLKPGSYVVEGGKPSEEDADTQPAV